MTINTSIEFDQKLQLPPTNIKYLCNSCDCDNAFYGFIDPSQWIIKVNTIPYVNNLEISFWAKCPKCGNLIYIGRID